MVVAVIEFHLDARSGVPPYQQLIRQVRHALRLGLLKEGDKLPTVKDVVARIAINPNTVLKAYRELEHDGLVTARQGVGTFVTRSLVDGSLPAHDGARQDQGAEFKAAVETEIGSCPDEAEQDAEQDALGQRDRRKCEQRQRPARQDPDQRQRQEAERLGDESRLHRADAPRGDGGDRIRQAPQECDAPC